MKPRKRWSFYIFTFSFILLCTTHFYPQIKTQDKGGKQGKPTIETVWWNVQLPISDNLVGIGSDFIYDDSEDAFDEEVALGGLQAGIGFELRF